MSRKASRPLIIALGPIWAVGAVLAGTLSAHFSAYDASLVALTAVVLYGMLIVRERSLLTTKSLICLYVWLGFVVRSWAILDDDTLLVPLRTILARPALESNLAWANSWTAVGLTAFLVGHHFTRTRRRSTRDLPFRSPPSQPPHLRTEHALAMMAIGSVGNLYKWTAGDLASRGVTKGGDFLLTFGAALTTAVGGLAAYALFAGSRQKSALIAAAWATALAFGDALLLGRKSSLLTVGAFAVAGWSGRARTRSLHRRVGRQVAIAVLIVYALTAAFSLASGGRGTGARNQVSSAATGLISRSYQVDSLVASRRYLESHDELLGRSFLQVPISWIPRQVWPGKPVSFSQTFGETVFYFSPLALSAFFTPGYGGEWYLNFGILGLVLGWLLLGALAGAADSTRSRLRRVVYAIALLHFVEGPVVTQVWFAAPLVIALLYATNDRDVLRSLDRDAQRQMQSVGHDA